MVLVTKASLIGSGLQPRFTLKGSKRGLRLAVYTCQNLFNKQNEELSGWFWRKVSAFADKAKQNKTKASVFNERVSYSG